MSSVELIGSAAPANSDPSKPVTGDERIVRRNLGGTFTGPRQTLVDILNPHVANWLQAKTKTLKKGLAAAGELKCYHAGCGTDHATLSSFDTAHPILSDRPVVIRKAIDELYPIISGDDESDVKDCDIKEVFARTRLLHEQLDLTFLCSPCNMNHVNLTGTIVAKNIEAWRKHISSLPNSRAARRRAKSQPDEAANSIGEVQGSSAT